MTELQIRIKTFLEGNGIKVTEDQLTRLTQAQQGAGKAAKEAGDAISQFGRRGSEAKDAFEGLTTVARGGEGAIFGMAKAWKALTVAFAANPITATLAVILGLLPLIQKGFDLWVKSAEAATKAMAGTGAATKSAAENIKAVGEASEKYIKAATTQADAMAAAYGRATTAIDKALSRYKQVEQARLDSELAANEVERQKALGGAKSDQERDAINAKFDAFAAEGKKNFERSLGDKELLAITQKGIAADDQKRGAQDAISGAASRTAAARAAEQAARKSGDAAAFGNALRAREAAEKDEAEVRKKFQPMLDQATNDADDATAAAQEFGFREKQARSQRESGSITTARDTATRTTSSRSREAELRRTAESAQARGDFEAQGKAVAELKGLRNSAKELADAVVETGQTTSAALKAATKEVEKQKRAAKASKESKAGS